MEEPETWADKFNVPAPRVERRPFQAPSAPPGVVQDDLVGAGTAGGKNNKPEESGSRAKSAPTETAQEAGDEAQSSPRLVR